MQDSFQMKNPHRLKQRNRKNTETLTKEKSSRKPTRYTKKEKKDGNSNGREESPKTYKVHK